jgi:hypothetical protein
VRVRVSDPVLLPELVEFLERREYMAAVTEQVGDDELLVSLLGSFSADVMQMQLTLIIGAWESGRSGRAVEILD